MTKDLEKKIQELEAELAKKEGELQKFWQDKEKITWTESEINSQRKKRFGKEKFNERKTEEIWNNLINNWEKEYPEEMKKIDISDLTNLALQVNNENIHDYEFLKQFCPEEPRVFFEICKGLKYYILDQLGNRILARCLIKRNEETWKKNGYFSAKSQIQIYLSNKLLLCGLMRTIDDERWNYREKYKELTNYVNNQPQTKDLQKLQTEKNTLITQITKLEKELTEKNKQLEQEKATIKKQTLAENEQEINKLRDKINKKLENKLLGPNEKGATLEQATDNLLEKQGKLENQIKELDKEISQQQKEKEILRNEINKEISKRGATLREAINSMVKEKCRNEKYVPTTGDKCLIIVTKPFKWISGKVGTGFALAGFGTCLPALLGGLGWLLKSWLTVKTGGMAGAFMVANDMTNREGNLPPTNQALPNQPSNKNLPPVVNNHYYTLPTHNRKETKKEPQQSSQEPEQETKETSQ